MRIEKLNVADAQNNSLNRNMATDSFTKNIQNQIANAQKQLQELSANETMNPEEKMKKRQEIQQQITDLNNQLRQHQIEQRKEKQQSKVNSNNNMSSKSNKNTNQSAGLSQASMTAIISADSAIATARTQNNVATKLEARAGVLETEIKLDSSRGGSVESKMEELAEVKQKASEIKSGSIEGLADVNNQIGRIDENINVSDKKAEKNDDKSANNNIEEVKQETTLYRHVDVRI